MTKVCESLPSRPSATVAGHLGDGQPVSPDVGEVVNEPGDLSLGLGQLQAKDLELFGGR
ncbi:MAG: hypothetical protein WC911_01660 [Thermoleophilia bacterium]